MTLQPPEVPVFRPFPPVGTVPDYLNDRVRDPLTFLESKVVFAASRANAWNVNSGLASRYVPWDTIDEDPYGGWVSPADTGGGGSTTLSAGTAVGAATFSVASAANLAINDYVRIGPAGANREYRRIANLSGTTVTPDDALALAHSSGEAVVEIVSDPSIYVCQAPGWYLASGAISISSAVATAAAQVLIPGLAVDRASPLGVGSPAWEGTEVFQQAAAVQHYASGLWEFYAGAGVSIRLNYFLSNETAGNIAVSTTEQCRLQLVWTSV